MRQVLGNEKKNWGSKNNDHIALIKKQLCAGS